MMSYNNQQPSSEENRNLLIALILAMVVMFGWRFLFPQPEVIEPVVSAVDTPSASVAVQDGAVKPVLESGVQDAPISLLSREEMLESGNRVRINTSELHGSINLKGARFDDLTLASYKKTQDAASEEVVLLTPRVTNEGYFTEFGWVGADIDVPDADTIWQADRTVLNEGAPVTLRWTNAQNVTFSQEISVDEHYMFTIKRRVNNRSGQAVRVAPYSLINRTLNEKEQAYLILHEGPLGVSNGILHEHDYDDLEDGKITYEQQRGWAGITDKYWLTSLIPTLKDQPSKTSYHHYKTGEDFRYQTDILADPVKISAGTSYSYDMQFFAGAKKVDVLDDYAKQYDIQLFDRAVDFGVLYFLTRPIFEALQWLYSILGNFGLAILALTVVIKAIMFPLANKSYGSMSQMKLLMPKMQEIRERFGDDRIKMNQEIMQLYKKEGVNPAAGCLPMILQIPVFFALYKVLFISIEMRHAPFYGWIKDLSVKDPTNIFTLFGTFPWNAPDLLQVGVLPIIMAVTMLIQQRLNPKPADPTQAQVMAVLPYMFLFVFAAFPAGLVLYWAWNNMLSVAQQYMITKRYEKLYDKETGKRLKKSKKS